MNPAQSARLSKEKYPNEWCRAKGCLWRTLTRQGYKPCPKHPSGAERVVPTVSQTTVEQTTALRAVARGIGPTVALPSAPYRHHGPYCKCRRCDVEI